MPKSAEATQSSPFLSQMGDIDSIQLNGMNGNNVYLTSQMLENYFAQAELSLSNKSEHPTLTELEDRIPGLAERLLSEFGLQSGQDVIKFLKSDEGKDVIAMIQKQLVALAEMEERLQENIREEQLIKEYRLAFLLLGLMYELEAEAHSASVEAEQEHEKLTKKEATAGAPQQAEAVAHPPFADHLALERYGEALSEMSKSLEDLSEMKRFESQSLDRDLEELMQFMEAASSKYKEFTDQVTEAYHSIEALPDSHEESIQTLEKRISALDELNDHDSHRIAALLDSGNEQEAREIMQITNARNLQVGALHDMLSVLNGEKALFKANGESTTSFSEAEFILPLSKQLVQDGDKYYLVQSTPGVTKTAKDLTEEEKDRGEKAYLRHRPEILGVRQLVQNNKEMEGKQHSQTRDRLIAQSQSIGKEIAFLTNQLQKIQAARANIGLQLKALSASEVRLTPLPTPSPGASPHAGKQPSYHGITPTLTKGNDPNFKLRGTDPRLLSSMREAINWLSQNQSGAPQPKQIKDLLKSLAQSPGQPIPQPLMKFMVAKQTSEMALKSTPALARYLESSPIPDPEPEEPSTAPTPFQWPPKPY